MNPGFFRTEPHGQTDTTDRFDVELEKARRAAERSYLAAVRALGRAERLRDRVVPSVATKTPTFAEVDELRALVAQRLDELRRVEQLMQPISTTPKNPVRIVNKGRTL